MSAPLWVTELASAFWALAGGPGPFPRDLRRPIQRALAISIVDRPGLSVGDVLGWLRKQGHDCPLDELDRPLRACLVCWGGAHFLFVEENDNPAERRFSLAHELAHFLRDYWWPRRRAEKRLGPAVREVFDGLRPPTEGERLHALLGRVSVGCHVHLLARDVEGLAVGHEGESERAADRLAYELLAPADSMLADPPARAADLAARLRDVCGLPTAQAGAYARALLPAPPRPSPLLARLWMAKKL